jgi:myo-inositol-1(or 4)-monophosphatase
VDYLETAIDLSRAAGDVLNYYAGREKIVEFKGQANLVTAADRKSEELIIGGILARYPLHSVLAEESGVTQPGAPVQWIIDPLDGTTNFAHGYPFYCVSIAVEENGEIVCGVVYDPVRDELFTAARGSGAFCNGEPIRVSDVDALSQALLITGFPYNFRERLQTVISQFEKFLVASQAVRRGGAAALDLCYVACGRLDGFWELHLQPWDTAAGRIILEEAGGKVTNFKGSPFSIYMKEILASNGRLHEEMMAVLEGTVSK